MDARFDPSKVHLIYLNKTDLSKLHLDYIHFKLLFFDPKDRTHQDSSSDEDKEIVYEGLLHNFQAAGQSDSYEILDVEYRTWLWGKKMGQLKWLPDPRRWWWYYGFRKEWVFFWALFFVGFFSVINYYRLNDLNQNVYQLADIPVLPKLGSEPFSWKRAKTRFWYSIVYTSSIFFRLTINVDKIRFNRAAAAFYILVIYVLGVVCLAYMANFVIQK
jgi:hypothetical protein